MKEKDLVLIAYQLRVVQVTGKERWAHWKFKLRSKRLNTSSLLEMPPVPLASDTAVASQGRPSSYPTLQTASESKVITELQEKSSTSHSQISPVVASQLELTEKLAQRLTVLEAKLDRSLSERDRVLSAQLELQESKYRLEQIRLAKTDAETRVDELRRAITHWLQFHQTKTTKEKRVKYVIIVVCSDEYVTDRCTSFSTE
jgi:hypothetical protein